MGARARPDPPLPRPYSWGVPDGFRIRPMTADDIDPANALARAQGWRDRARLYAFVLRVPTCRPLVGTIDGRIVATGLATANGPVGWLGAIIVDSNYRRRGFGRTMTEELIGRLRADGCQTISLEATEAGRPLYDRLGFRVHCHYIEMDPAGEAVEPAPPPRTRLRRMKAADLPAVSALDRAATGEDRHAALTLLAEESGWILEDDSGLPEAEEWLEPAPAIRGFLLPSDRGHGAIVAPLFEDGEFLMRLHHFVGRAGPGPRCGMPDAHGPDLAELAGRGWHDVGRLPRMVLGADPIWRPTWIWGQINSAMG